MRHDRPRIDYESTTVSWRYFAHLWGSGEHGSKRGGTSYINCHSPRDQLSLDMCAPFDEMVSWYNKSGWA